MRKARYLQANLLRITRQVFPAGFKKIRKNVGFSLDQAMKDVILRSSGSQGIRNKKRSNICIKKRLYRKKERERERVGVPNISIKSLLIL